MKRFGRLCTLAFVVAVLAAAAPRARATVDEFIPKDAVLVVKVQDLDGSYARLKNGWLVARLRDPAFLPDAAAGLSQVDAAIAQVKQQHGVDMERAALDVIGRECALALFADQTGVLVAEAADPQTLASAIAGIRRVDQASGNLISSTTSDYKGVTVTTDTRKDGTQHWAVVGRALALSEQRAGLEKAIDVSQGTREPLSRSELYGEAMGTAGTGQLATAYLDAGALQPAVDALMAEAARKPAGDRAVQRRIALALASARYAVATLREEQGLVAQLTIAHRDGRLPAGLRALLPEAGAALDIASAMPADAVFVGARNMSWAGAWSALTELAREADPAGAGRLDQGMEAVVSMIGGVYSKEQLLAELGGQSALCVVRAAAADEPPGAVLAVRLNETAHIPLALESIVGAGCTVARAEGKQDTSLERSEHAGVHLTTVRIHKPGMAGKLSPTFGVVGKDLIVATSLESARQAVTASRSGARPQLPTAPGTVFAAGRLNAGALAGLVSQYRETLVRHAMTKEGKPEDKARADLAALEKLLSLFDGVEYASAFGQDRTDHVLRLRVTAAQQ